MFNFDLSQDIEAFLLKQNSCREFDIISHLQSLGRLPKNCLSTSLSLFRCHFLVFNALYRLQLLARIKGSYQLEISSLLIELSKPDAASTQESPDTKSEANFELRGHDKLALFYLDLSQLNQTKEEDVNVLLNQFWQQYLHSDEKDKALAVLGLEEHAETIDFTAIKKQYRRLAMKHHPDRGGKAEDLISIQQAMTCLELYYPQAS